MPGLNQPPDVRLTEPGSGLCQPLARQEGLGLRHLKQKSHTCTFKSTHQTSSFYTHVIWADVEAGSPISDTLGLTNVETITSGSAGQFTLLVCTNCNTETQHGWIIAQHICLSEAWDLLYDSVQFFCAWWGEDAAERWMSFHVVRKPRPDHITHDCQRERESD